MDNWDFEAADNGGELKLALEYMRANPEGLASVFENNYRNSHTSVWQALDEMANVYSVL